MIGNDKAIGNERTLTKTLKYVFPLLFDGTLSHEQFFNTPIRNGYLKKSFVLNAFLYDSERPQYDNHVFLLLDFTNPLDCTVRSRLVFNKHFKEAIHITDDDRLLCLYVYERSDELNTVITLLSKGLYTELSSAQKAKINNFWKEPRTSVILSGIESGDPLTNGMKRNELRQFDEPIDEETETMPPLREFTIEDLAA